jgi:hypothetical protein
VCIGYTYTLVGVKLKIPCRKGRVSSQVYSTYNYLWDPCVFEGSCINEVDEQEASQEGERCSVRSRTAEFDDFVVIQECSKTNVCVAK